jgi:hypothetical protein
MLKVWSQRKGIFTGQIDKVWSQKSHETDRKIEFYLGWFVE